MSVLRWHSISAPSNVVRTFLLGCCLVLWGASSPGSRPSTIPATSSTTDLIAAPTTGLTAAPSVDDTDVARALDNAHLQWQLSGNVPGVMPWRMQRSVTHDGIDALQSGQVKANQECSVSTRVQGPLRLSFWWKVDSEPRQDELVFRVDGTEVPGCAISGRQDWTRVTHELPGGLHTLTWTYRKDGSTSIGADAGWLDQVQTDPAIGRENPLHETPPQPGDHFWTLRCTTIPNRFYQLMSRGRFPGATWKPGTESAERAAGGHIEFRIPEGIYPKNEYRVQLVEPPSLIRFPAAQEDAVLGKPFTFEAEADGTPEILYQWYYIPTTSGGNTPAQPVKLEGADKKTLTLKSVTQNSAGAYFAVATNSAGSENCPTCSLKVRVPPRILRVTSHPDGNAFTGGVAAKLSVDAEGEPPLKFQWSRDDVPVAGGTARELSFSSPEAEDAGRYSVVVTNAWGECRSEPKPITVLLTPSIVSAPKDLTVHAGDHVLLQIEARGEQPFQYRWFRDGLEIAGAIGASYTCDTNSAGEATYRAEVNNALKVAAMSDEVFVKIILPETSRIEDLGLDLVPVRAGLFKMGSAPDAGCDHERPQREVRISEIFWIGATEVTRGQWAAVFPNTAKPKPNELALPQPASFDDAQDFCRQLTRREREAQRLGPDFEYALPTEAQWEYACRQGGDDAKAGWFFSNGHVIQAQPVATKKRSTIGTYDMLGNAWEWTADWYGPYDPNLHFDPTGPKEGQFRVLRGGSANSPEDSCRAAARYFDLPNKVQSTYGFRIVKRQVRRAPEGYKLGPGSATRRTDNIPGDGNSRKEKGAETR